MVLTLDTETTTHNHGNPFNQRNELVCVASKVDKEDTRVTYNDYGAVKYIIGSADVIVGFNIKFDHHWLRKYGLSLEGKRIWDCQLAEFLINNQIGSYPSLNECCEKHGLGQKLDVIEEEYWKRGVQTNDISRDVLSRYAATDVDLTYALYLKQKELLTGKKLILFKLMCQDLHVLAEMEWNGLLFNEELCEERSKSVEKSIKEITDSITKDCPVAINLSSNDQLSAFLYGGTISTEIREPIGYFKTGPKTGQPRFRVVLRETLLPRLYEPIRSLSKEGVYSTDEGSLKQLKGNRVVVDKLLELSKLEKLNGTYYKGIPALNKEMNWPKGKLHGQLNQCVAQTGRLSASKPNQQNFSGEMLDCFISRYD